MSLIRSQFGPMHLTKNDAIVNKADSPHTPKPRVEQTNTTIPGEIQVAMTQSEGMPSASNASHSLAKANHPSASQTLRSILFTAS